MFAGFANAREADWAVQSTHFLGVRLTRRETRKCWDPDALAIGVALRLQHWREDLKTAENAIVAMRPRRITVKPEPPVPVAIEMDDLETGTSQ